MLISACTVVVKLRSRLASEEAEELLAWRGSPTSAKRIMPDLAKTSSSNLTQVCLHMIIRESWKAEMYYIIASYVTYKNIGHF